MRQWIGVLVVVGMGLPALGVAQSSAAQKSEPVATVAQQAVGLILKEYALDPAATVDQSGVSLSKTGKWQVGNKAPAVCPQTTENCVEVFYRVPELQVLCEWIVLLPGDGTTGTVIEQNDAATRYLVRRLSTEDAGALASNKKRPVYPPIAQAAHVGGEVVIAARISEKNEVTSLSVLSGPEMLRGAALDATKAWTFKPLMVGDRRIGYQTEVRFQFRTTGSGGVSEVTSRP